MKLRNILCLGALLLAGFLSVGGIAGAALPQPLCTRGEIVELEDNSIVVKGEGAYPLVKVMLDTTVKNRVKPTVELQGRVKRDMGINLGLHEETQVQGTLLLDGANGRLLNVKKLAVGKQVVAYYDGNVTRSYPPQAKGEAVVLITKPDKVGQYLVVEKAELSADRKAMLVTSTSQDLIATIPGRACCYYREIKPGTKLLLWSDIMTLSLPAQTVATKAKIVE